MHHFDINILCGDRLLLIYYFEQLQILSQICILDEAGWLGKDLEVGVIWSEKAKLHRIEDLCQGALRDL